VSRLLSPLTIKPDNTSSLDELDDDLMLELNQVVRENQLATLPFARSGRAEALLFDKYPELAERIEKGKRAKVDAIVLSNKFSETEGLVSTSFRAQSLEEVSASPLRQRTRRRASRETKNAESPALTPALKAKSSVPDLMFDMSDGDEQDESDARIRPPQFTDTPRKESLDQGLVEFPGTSWSAANKRQPITTRDSETNVALDFQTPSSDMRTPGTQSGPPGQPWGAAPLGISKLDLKDIMSQTSTDGPSNLTIGLSRQEQDEKPSGSFHARMSQRERKRMQQTDQLGQPKVTEKPQPTPPAASPWQAMSHRKSSQPSSPAPAPSPQPSGTPSTPHLTMRQTIANKGVASKHKDQQNSSPSQGSRSISSSTKIQHRPASANGPGMSVSTDPIPTPRSVRHVPLPSHSPTSPSQHLTMMEILSLQQAEKDYVKDAASKRSLQEIQQEQEFQQWWDQESKRVMLEEEQMKRTEERAVKASRGRVRGRGGKSKGKGKEKKDGDEAETSKGSKDASIPAEAQEVAIPKSTSKHDSSDKGRGRGGYRGGRGGGGRGGRGPRPMKDGSATPMSAPKEQNGSA
jgi:hypothetical protein